MSVFNISIFPFLAHHATLDTTSFCKVVQSKPKKNSFDKYILKINVYNIQNSYFEPL